MGRGRRAPGLQLREAPPQTPNTQPSRSARMHTQPPGRGGKRAVSHRTATATENQMRPRAAAAAPGLRCGHRDPVLAGTRPRLARECGGYVWDPSMGV